ncbi:MAG: type II toxin-antitoxin system ParD family antitoxin [Xanthobacteraceae bacterium]|jgi:putative addiction module CopG family antidote
MPRLTQLTITLPEEMVAMIRDKVATGEYQSESDVVRDGLHALQAGDSALEDWLGGEVVPVFDAMRADPSRALSIEQVRASLATLHEEKLKPGGG